MQSNWEGNCNFHCFSNKIKFLSAARRQKKKAVVQEAVLSRPEMAALRNQSRFFMSSKRHIGGCRHAFTM